MRVESPVPEDLEEVLSAAAGPDAPSKQRDAEAARAPASQSSGRPWIAVGSRVSTLAEEHDAERLEPEAAGAIQGWSRRDVTHDFRGA